MSPSSADFSEIAQLREYRRLYEEQEEKIHVQLQQKDESVSELRQLLNRQKEETARVESRLQEALLEGKRIKEAQERAAKDNHEKTDKLMERIKELNQRLVAS